ncbi:hypothetical protein ACJRO7_028795 [Eucalyptus globulus]|uniref:Nodulin-like domain-containing protein n=1 Tax=Eucalyptus globulus TaxID=34317 RepID=A0ABD3JVR8_EUCGL
MGRWFIMFASLLIMAAAGATYMFGLDSGDIKTSLGYDQSTLNLLSFFKDLDGSVGIPSGLINEVWQMCLYICIGANSQAFANTGALITCVQNFSESQGVALGILKG